MLILCLQMLVITATWGMYFLMILGAGLLLRWAYGDRQLIEFQSILDAFWLGWAVWTISLLVWNLVFPVHWVFTFLAAVSGIIGLLLHGQQIRALFRGFPPPVLLLAATLVGVVIIFAANQAAGPPRVFDTGMYHLMAVQWAKAYPALPGLGNLQVHLSHMTSHFLFAAALTPVSWLPEPHHITNGLFVLVLGVQVVSSSVGFFFSDSRVRVHQLFYVLIAGAVITQIDYRLSSLSNDVPVTVLTLVLTGQLLAILESPDETRSRRAFLIFQIAIIAAASVTLKLSMVALAGTTVTVALAVWWVWSRQEETDTQVAILWTGGVIIATLVAWVTRSTILSGHLLFPVLFTALPVDWAIPYPLALDEANWVLSWARDPGTHWREVLDSHAWFDSWVSQLFEIQNWGVFAAMGMAFLGVTISISEWASHGGRRARPRWLWLGLLPVSLSLLFWFLTAPAVRFAEGLAWALGAALLALAASKSRLVGGGWLSVGAFVIIMGASIMGLLLFHPVSGSEASQEIPKVALESFETKSGVVLALPSKGTQCWDAPIPCTNAPQPGLELRLSGSFRHGFRLVGDPSCYEKDIRVECPSAH